MNDYLAHYGVLGMKWGVRRFQNKDGSLTAAGKARYGGGKAEAYRVKLLRKANKMNKHGEYDTAIKRIKSASNDEIATELANRNSKAKKIGAYSAAGGGTAAFLGNAAQIKAANENGVTLVQLNSVPMTAIVSYFAGKGISKLSYSKNLINKYNETPTSDISKQSKNESAKDDMMARKYPRNSIEKKEMKKRDNEIREEYFNSVNKEKEELDSKYKAKEESLWNEMNELTKKHSFDLDDGGNARTKEDAKAARRYMEIWDEIDSLEDKKFAEAKKVAEKDIHSKYGDIGSAAIKDSSPFVSFGKKKY